jgi:endonuclease III
MEQHAFLRALWEEIRNKLGSELPNWEDRIIKLEQVVAVERRLRGETWSDPQVFEALLRALLSGNTDWSRVAKVQEDLQRVFCNFDFHQYANLEDADIHKIAECLERKKAGAPQQRIQLRKFRETCRRLVGFCAESKSAESYFLELVRSCGDDPVEAAIQLGTPGQYKLPGFGVPLAAEALRNLGFDIAKPDRHILRAVANFGLVQFPENRRHEKSARSQTCSEKAHPASSFAADTGRTSDHAAPSDSNPAKCREIMIAVGDFARAVGEKVVFVDNAIWLLCAREGPCGGAHLKNSELQDLAARARMRAQSALC